MHVTADFWTTSRRAHARHQRHRGVRRPRPLVAKPVLVDFFATWCGRACASRRCSATLAEGAPAEVEFVKVDVDEAQELTLRGRRGIRAMPTFKMFKGGAEVGMVRGADEAAIRDLLRQPPVTNGRACRAARRSARRRRRRDERPREAARRPRAPRGLGGAGGGTGAGAGARRRAGAAGAAAVRRRGGREPRVHLGPRLAPPRRRAPVARRARLAAATTRTKALAAAMSPRRCKRRRRPPAPPSRQVRGSARAAQGDGLHRRGTACTLALDAAGGDVTAMGRARGLNI